VVEKKKRKRVSRGFKRVSNNLIVGSRKLMKIGDSVVIALPKEFLETHGLKAGDRVPIIANHILKIVPMLERSDEEDIELLEELEG